MLSSDREYRYVGESSSQLVLTVTGDNACTFTDSVYVQVNPLPEFDISGQAEVCAEEANVLSVNADGWQSLVWHDGADTLFTDTNQVTVSLTESTEIFAALVDANSCATERSFTITVNPLPEVHAGTDTLICYGEQVVIGGTYTNPSGLSFSWSPQESLDDPTSARPVASPDEPVEYALTVTTTKGCTSTDSVYVEVNPEIIVEAGPDVEVCLGDSVQLGGHPTASGSRFGYEYQWIPATSLTNAAVANPLAFPAEDMIYHVLVISGRCTVEYDSVSVTVNPLPEPVVIEDQSMGAGESITLHAEGGVSYEWSPAQSLNDHTLQSPDASPEKTTTYSVVVTDENGCSETGQVDVLVKNQLFIPTLFTPNGDGSNDNFRLFGSGVEQIELSVFDQTGTRVYHTGNLSEAFGTGWDGTYKGVRLRNDIYIWTIEGRYYNGEKVTFDNKITGIIKLVK